MTLEEVISAAGFDDQQRSDLLAGKIVTKDFDEGSDKEMSILVALKVSLSLPELLAARRELLVLDFDEDLIAIGRIGADQDASEALAEIEFTAEEGDEIRGLLGVEPGSDFNLSKAEIARFAALDKRFSRRGRERDAACRAAVNETYRSVLAGRLTAYQEGGLEAISHYARSRGKVADSGEELHLAAENLPLARRRVPDVYRAWLEYPRAQPCNGKNAELAVALPPVVKLAPGYAEPVDQSPDAQVRCNPGSVQSSPMSFFACTRASVWAASRKRGIPAN